MEDGCSKRLAVSIDVPSSTYDATALQRSVSTASVMPLSHPTSAASLPPFGLSGTPEGPIPPTLRPSSSWHNHR